MADYELSANLSDEQILQALRRINDQIEVVAIEGGESFERMGDSAAVSGVKIGAVAGFVQELTSRLLDMAKQGVQAFRDLIEESISLAQVQRNADAQIEARLRSTQGAVGLTLQEIKSIASELQTATNFGDENIQRAQALLLTFTQITKENFADATATVLDMSEAFDQDLKSSAVQLGKALEDPIQGVNALRRVGVSFTEQQKEQIKTLVESGRTVEAQNLVLQTLQVQVAGSAAAAREADGGFKAFQNTIGDFQEVIGDPVVEKFSEILEKLQKIIADNSEDLNLIAEAIGDMVAAAVDFIGTKLVEYIENLDTEKFLEFIGTAQESLELTLELGENLIGIGENLGILQGQFGGLNEQLERMNGLLETANQLSAIFRLSQMARDPETLKALFQAGREGGFNLENFVQTINRQSGGELASVFGVETPTGRRGGSAARGGRTPTPETKAQTETDKEATDATEEYAEARKKLNDAFEKFDTDKARAEADLFLKQQRALLDFEIKASQEREKLARKNLQDIAKIHRRHSDDISKTAIDLTRDEEDIARKGARKQIELEQDIAKERIRAEEDFQRELQRIKARFEFDARRAIKANDAIAFLDAMERRDFEIEQAREGKDEQINEAERTAVERREALQSQLQQEIEDAKLANARKLEDLRTSLAISLREQQIKYQQEVQEQAIAEQQKREALRRTQEQQIQDFNTYWQRRLEDLNRNYQREIEITRRYEAQLAALRARSLAAATRGLLSDPNSLIRQRNEGEGRFGGLREIRAALAAQDSSPIPAQRRHSGGRVIGGNTYLIGRHGAEEEFRPDMSGMVSPIPNSVMFNPVTSPQISNTVNNVNRTTNLNIEAMLNNLSPQQVAIVTALINQLNMSYIS